MGCFEVFAEGQSLDAREEDLFGKFGGRDRGNEAEEAKEDGKDGWREIHRFGVTGGTIELGGKYSTKRLSIVFQSLIVLHGY